MLKILSALALTLGLLLQTAQAGSYFRVVSWNTLHMGWSGQTDWTGYARQVWEDFGTSSSSPNGVDAIFLQEVMYSSALPSFTSALSAVSGVNWSYAYTNAVGRSSYKERYAVVYRTDRVSLVSHYLWPDSSDLFEREPQVVRLRDRNTGADFTFINWHTIFGSTSQRQQELRDIAIVFNDVQADTGSDQDIILLGDHNRDATSSYWNTFKSTSSVYPAVSYKVNSKTSINTSCNYASAYDHFWFQNNYVTEYSSSGRDYIGNTCTFRNGLSDHAPVWLRLYSSYDSD